MQNDFYLLIGDGKLIVEEFVKTLLPAEPEVKKPKGGKKGGKGSAKKGKKR
jgi:hypothetical protein